MKIVLKINEENNIKLSLFLGKKEKDSLEWKDENSLSRILLANLDKLLRKNGVGLDKISGYKIISDVPENWTSVRIAEITFKSLALAKKNRPC
jgi:tRNA A37 threonylcarbamoyladenosine modification protein TsaB